MQVSKAIRTAYYTALAGNITHNGNNVPVFDVYALPEDTDTPYILLSTQSAVQFIIKNCKRYDTSLLVDVVTGSSEPKGRSDAEDIAEQIGDIINPDTFIDLDLSAYGYQMGNTRLENETDISSKGNKGYIYRKLMRYSHLIIKN